MQIRKEQMDVLGRHMEAVFVTRTVDHVRRFFPEPCRALGEDGTRETVVYGVERAATHGFTAQSDVSKYIDVMFAYGRDFDQSPALPWARHILADPALNNPEIRINALCDEAIARQGAGGVSNGAGTPAAHV